MKYKAVILDMDGTLLDDRKRIPCRNITVLQKLYKMGVVVMVATGRRYLFAKPVLEKLDFPVAILPNNGNCLWLTENDCKICAKYIPERIFKSVLKEGHSRNLYPVLHVDHYDEGYDYITEFDFSHPAYNSYIRIGNKRHRVVKNLFNLANPNVMIMCYADNFNKLKEFRKTIQKKFPKSLHSHITLSLKRIGPLLEISHHEGTKWNTAVDYASAKGIKPSEIIAVGDDSNDIKMLKNAGLGIAMKNAIPQAKKVADLVTEFDNNQAGVARILETVFNIR